MELTIKGKPNEIADLLQHLNWQRMDIPQTPTTAPEWDKWFKDLKITCSPINVVHSSELSELSCK